MDITFLAADPMQIGTKWNGSPGSVFVTDEWGNLKTVNMNGSYRDIVHRQHVFYVSTQAGVAGQAVSVFNSGTYTGLYLWNPTGSTVSVSILAVSTALSIAEVAISAIFIGKIPAMTTETSQYTPVCCAIPSGTAGQCHAGYAATITAPTVVYPIVGGALASAMPYRSGDQPIQGLFEFGPGAGVCIMAMSAVTGWFGFLFEEIPL